MTRAIEEIYRYPLRQTATDTLNRQLRSGICDSDLAHLVVALREEDRLCLIHEEEQTQEPRIICSMGLSANKDQTDWFRPQPGPHARLPLKPSKPSAREGK